MLAFLESNDVKINATNKEVVDVELGLADGTKNYNDLFSWIISHEKVF